MTATVSRKRPRWYQFTLRRLLIFTAMVGLLLGWIISKRRVVWQEDQAVAEIQKQGGRVTRSFDALAQERPSRIGILSRMLLFGQTFDFPVSSVSLSCCPDPEVTEHFRHLRALRTVELPGCQIGDAEIPNLVVCGGSIEKLDLSATNITDAGITQLRSLSDLTSVAIDHTAVTAEGLDAFSGMKLKHFSMRNTTISEEAADEFRAAHPELVWFDHECSRSDKDRNAIKQLTQLGATFPGYHDWGRAALGETESMVVRLSDGIADLFMPWHGCPEDLDQLASIDSRLDVGLQDSVCACQYLERLAKLDTTESLFLRLSVGQLPLLKSLRNMTNLERLSVWIESPSSSGLTTLSGGDFDYLSQLPNLNEFHLSFLCPARPPVCLPADQAALLPIAQCQKLRHVALYNIDISEETLATLVETSSFETMKIRVQPGAQLSEKTIDKYMKELEARAAAGENRE